MKESAGLRDLAVCTKLRLLWVLRHERRGASSKGWIRDACAVAVLCCKIGDGI